MDPMTALTLVDFLRARLDEYEAVAREWVACEYSGVDVWGEGADHFFEGGAGSPARVLADVEAKRRIVDLHEDPAYSAGAFSTEGEERSMNTLRILALPYADRPDYDEGWRA